MTDARIEALGRLVEIVDRLRDPQGGCPWDLEQTVASLAPSMIEEAHELVEAVEQDDESGVVEEAGDVLMLIALISRVASQAGGFDLARVADGVADKLVRRHPHVFGEAEVGTADGAIESWERIKQRERAERETDASALAGVPTALPALQRADRLGAKARAAGFRWPSASGAVDKVHEELGELGEALEGGSDERIEAELGDLLLALATLAGYLGLDPERALRGALRRYERRFRSMESALGGTLEGATLERMTAAWRSAKSAE